MSILKVFFEVMPQLIPILHEPHLLLRARAKEIDLAKWKAEELQKLAQDMVYTMKKAPGVGLAAPQIGQSIRLIIVEYTPKPLILINPKIVSHAWRRDLLEEGCLSVPGKWGQVKRYRSVKVRAQTLDGTLFEMEAQGFLSQIFQHEIDHLNGVLYIDKAIKLF